MLAAWREGDGRAPSALFNASLCRIVGDTGLSSVHGSCSLSRLMLPHRLWRNARQPQAAVATDHVAAPFIRDAVAGELRHATET